MKFVNHSAKQLALYTYLWLLCISIKTGLVLTESSAETLIPPPNTRYSPQTQKHSPISTCVVLMYTSHSFICKYIMLVLLSALIIYYEGYGGGEFFCCCFFWLGRGGCGMRTGRWGVLFLYCVVQEFFFLLKVLLQILCITIIHWKSWLFHFCERKRMQTRTWDWRLSFHMQKTLKKRISTC